MRYFLISIWCSVAAALTASAAPPQNFYINNSEVLVPPDTRPTINAVRFVNRGTFNINSFFLGLPTTISSIIGFSPQPFEVLNMHYFTNTSAGVMNGSPGFRFDYFHGNTRERMQSWVNLGEISASTWLMALSQNVVSSGPMSVGPSGLLRMDGGNNLNMARVGLRAGVAPGISYADGFAFPPFYINSAGVSDIYWAVGTNNVLGGMGRQLSLTAGFFNLPFPQSPTHEVRVGRLTNVVTVPLSSFFFVGTNLTFFNAEYNAFAYTNRTSPTSSVVQVVFIPTNNIDTNFSTDVRFFGFLNEPATAVVEFKSVDFDIVQQVFTTNAVYLTDTAGIVTNFTLLRPFLTTIPGRRPNNFEVTRNPPFEFLLGTTGNTAYADTLLYNPNYVSNTVTVTYSAYAAQISSGGTNTSVTGEFEPRRFPGRIELLGNNKVNLEQTRARAESTIIIKAGNLVNNKLPTVDAPFCIYDLTSVLPTPLVISNLAPAAVRRLSGQIAAWSAVWQNTETNALTTNTQTIKFQVLIVDNRLQALQPVLVNEFAAKAPALVIQDNLNIGRRLRLDTRSLTVSGGLSLPFGSSWARSNVASVLYFTNSGFINIARDGFFGADRPTPYYDYVNSGTNIAAGQFIRANNFENSGCIIARAGVLSVEAGQASLLGTPLTVTTNVFTNIFLGSFGVFTNIFTNAVTNVSAKLAGAGDVRIIAGELTASNSFIASGAFSRPGTLEITVGQRISDGGTNGLNRWFTTGGFECNRLPVEGNLLGTHITSQAPFFSQESFHTWCGLDVGPVADGYVNNMAVGKLTLTGTNFSLFRFSASAGAKRNGQSRAIYVDYLELLNNALDVNNAIEVDPSFTIYFAAANVDVEKLGGAAGGRIVWVSDFAGPFSSTNIFYASTGQTYTFNIALVTSKNLDSDGDGIVNADDPEPIPVPAALAAAVPELLNLSISRRSEDSRHITLSWLAPANSINYLESKASFSATDWTMVTNFVNGVVASQTSVEVSPTKERQRIYRVRIVPQ